MLTRSDDSRFLHGRIFETPNANLIDGMHWLLSTYTSRLNRRHETPGHILSGRYKALVVENGGGYLKTVCDYVHLNPVRANLVGSQDRLLSFRGAVWCGMSRPRSIVRPGCGWTGCWASTAFK